MSCGGNSREKIIERSAAGYVINITNALARFWKTPPAQAGMFFEDFSISALGQWFVPTPCYCIIPHPNQSKFPGSLGHPLAD
jgi:hypothetical protein